MKNFIFKSTGADLQKMFQQIETMQKNVLYITHQVDFIRKKVLSIDIDKRLQSRVDDYFKDDEINNIGQHPEDIRDID